MSAAGAALHQGEVLVHVALWSAALIGAVVLARRAAPGERGAWWLVAAAAAAIVLDKAFDLQMVGWRAAVWLLDRLDPERSLRDGPLDPRIALLALAFVAGCAAVYWLVRGDRALHGPKLVALGGLVLLMAWLALRVAPALKQQVGEGADRLVEGAAWLAVAGGELWQARARVQRDASQSRGRR